MWITGDGNVAIAFDDGDERVLYPEEIEWITPPDQIFTPALSFGANAMKVPLSWLREYVDIDLPPEDLAHRLTMAGTEVGSIDVVGGSWENVFVGYVTSVDPHPNADRLRLATISLGRRGDDRSLRRAKRRGGAEGALRQGGSAAHRCPDWRDGDAEGGPDSRRGVCGHGVLGAGACPWATTTTALWCCRRMRPVGTPLQEYMGDVVFDLDVTPNRPDCLSVLGVAREVAALTRSGRQGA